jgi:hypothetical protein
VIFAAPSDVVFDGLAGHLAGCLLFGTLVGMLLERDELLHEARRVEPWNPAWARNRRRRAAKLFEQAVVLAGERGLPWGIQD